MSLLLKALSRVENREQTPPVEAQVPPPEPSIPVEERANVAESECASAPAVATPALEPPLWTLSEATEAFVEEAAPEAEVGEHAAPEQPTVDEQAVEQPAVVQPADNRADIELPKIEEELITESAAGIEPVMQMPDSIPPVEASSTAGDVGMKSDVESLPDAVPLPVEDTLDGNFGGDVTFEPLWQQLEKLQDLVSSDAEQLDFDSFKFENVVDLPVDVTETETLEIETIEPTAPPIIPLREPNPVPAPTLMPIPAIVLRVEPAITPASKVAEIQPAATVAALNIKPEYRELRDQLLARLNIAKHPTVLLIDAGRRIGDVSWLLPLASSILEKLNATSGDTRPQILLVEAAGAECGLARTLGLDAHLGLTHVLSGQAEWRAAIQPTQHPQIKLLGRGAQQLRCDDQKRLAKLWTELTPQFDLILVAAGPRNQTQPGGRIERLGSHSATAVFPHASAAILCVELNGTSQAEAVETKRLLDSRGIKVLGCIVQPT